MTAATTASAGEHAVSGGNASPAEVAVVAGVAFLLEAAPLSLLSGTIPLIVLALHLYIVGSLALWMFWRRRVIDQHFALMLLLTTAVLGPIGSAGCLVALAMSILLRRGPDSYRELERTLFPEIKLSPQEPLVPEDYVLFVINSKNPVTSPENAFQCLHNYDPLARAPMPYRRLHTIGNSGGT